MAASAYFDLNGCIGKGVFGMTESEWPEPSDLLAHLNYLGISRTLVWDYEARDVNPTIGNRHLIEKLAENPEVHRRLIPVFSITPASVMDHDGIDLLKFHLTQGSVRALRVFTYSPRFNLGALILLLEQLRDFSAVIIWSVVLERNDLNDLCEIAERFPNFTFLLTQTTWMNLSKGLDLLIPQRNVLVDTSWMFTDRAIEMLVGALGEERVVFGTVSKTHYGASIAALEHSEVTDSVKEKIAHGNIERILHMQPDDAPLPACQLLSRKPFWCTFRAGRRLSGVKIIDAHGHSGPYSYCGWTPANDQETVFKNIVKKMDSLGIGQMILSHIGALYGDCLAGNRELERIAASGFHGRLLGYLAFNPYYREVMTPELDYFFAGGFFKGFKVLADYWKVPVTDSVYETVWSYADRYHLPILLHTWDTVYSTPRLLTDIVKKYPHAVFLIGHAGGKINGRREAETLAMENNNVFLEFCGSFTAPVDWADTLERVGFDHVVFGSDADGHNQAWELGRLLSLPVPDDQLLPVLAGNMQNILSGIRLQEA